MKTQLETIKTWFETGDIPTEEQFHNAFDSFFHKDDGDIITKKVITQEGNIIFTFSDGTDLRIDKYQPELTQPMEYIEGLIEKFASVDIDISGLGLGKVDKEEGKGLSSNDYTAEEKEKLASIDPMSFNIIMDNDGNRIYPNNPSDTLTIDGAVIDEEARRVVIDKNNLSIRDKNGIEQFIVNEYLEFEGFSFDIEKKRIKYTDNNVTPSSTTSYYYVHTLLGDNETAVVNNSSKPYQSIDSVFAEYDHTIDLSSQYIVIVLQNQATFPINGRCPYINLEFRSNLFVNISFTGNTQGTNLFYTSNGSKSIRWYWNIPNGRILDNKSVGESSLNTEDLISVFNVNEINITSPGGNNRYFGRTYIIKNVNRLISKWSIGASLTTNLSFDYINATGYTPNASLIVYSDSSVEINLFVDQLVTGGKPLTRILRTGRIALRLLTGDLLFHYSNSPITVEFLDTPSVTLKLNQTVTQVTLKGRVKLLNFTGKSTNGSIDFLNLIVDDSTGILEVDDGTLKFKNCALKVDSRLMKKTNIGYVTIENSTIRQKNITELIDSTGAGITINVGGLSTNATAISNNLNDTLVKGFVHY